MKLVALLTVVAVKFLLVGTGFSAINGALSAFLAVLLIFTCRGGRSLQLDYISLSLLGMFVLLSYATVVALVRGGSSILAIVDLFRFVSGLCVFMAAKRMAEIGRGRQAYEVIVFVIVVHTLAGILSYIAGFGEVIHGQLRVSGISGKTNMLANIALLAFAVGAAELVRPMHRGSFRVGVVLLASGVGAMLATATLKNVLAAIFVVLLALFFILQRPRYLVPFVLFLAAITGSILLLVGDVVLERFAHLLHQGFDFKVVSGQAPGSSLEWRIIHWKLLFEDWVHGGVLSGVGLGQVPLMNGLKLPSGLGFDAHSDVFRFLLELGVFGFFMWFVAFTLMSVEIVRVVRRNSPFSAVLLFALVGQVAASVAGPVFYSASTMIGLWFIAGLCVGSRGLSSVYKAS